MWRFIWRQDWSSGTKIQGISQFLYWKPYLVLHTAVDGYVCFSFKSLTWEPIVHCLILYDGQFRTNYACGDPSILMNRIIHNQNHGRIGDNVHLPTSWQILYAFMSFLITLMPVKYLAMCKALLCTFSEDVRLLCKIVAPSGTYEWIHMHSSGQNNIP